MPYTGTCQIAEPRNPWCFQLLVSLSKVKPVFPTRHPARFAVAALCPSVLLRLRCLEHCPPSHAFRTLKLAKTRRSQRETWNSMHPFFCGTGIKVENNSLERENRALHRVLSCWCSFNTTRGVSSKKTAPPLCATEFHKFAMIL